VPVAVSGGALSLHQGGGEDAHPARSAHISEGKLHDVHALDLLLPESGATYVMDRGYVDFARLHLLHQAGAFFVTRAKSNLHAHRLYTGPTDRASDIICDPSHWMVTTPKKDYPETSAPHPFQGCRHRQDAGVPHQPIRLAGGNSALYKSRWQVELFFKWIKQHLRIKQFYGTSENAVKTQIWIAVSVYVLVAIVKKRLGLDASLYTLLQILSVTLFEKMPMQQALSATQTTCDNRSTDNQLNLFAF
jgi:Transposase DDE domain